MANKKLIEDLMYLTRGEYDWRDYSTPAIGKDVADVANRALNEIKHLQDQIDTNKEEVDQYRFWNMYHDRRV